MTCEVMDRGCGRGAGVNAHEDTRGVVNLPGQSASRTAAQPAAAARIPARTLPSR